jgi:hypothetical protein
MAVFTAYEGQPASTPLATTAATNASEPTKLPR